MKTYTMFVLTNCKEGREDEFNDWYSGRHLDDVLNVPGFISGQRFKAVDVPDFPPPAYRYGATFEVQTDDPQATVAELFRRHDTPELPSCDAMDPASIFGMYESMTPVVRK